MADHICANDLYESFPETLLRGFNSKECFTVEQNVAKGAFQFHDHTTDRNDNYHEASINWEDDENAVSVLMEQIKEGTSERMFKYGYSRLPYNQIKSILSSMIGKEYLAFERKPLLENPYHGNILIRGTIKSQEKSMIQDVLAAIANNDVHPMNL